MFEVQGADWKRGADFFLSIVFFKLIFKDMNSLSEMTQRLWLLQNGFCSVESKVKRLLFCDKRFKLQVAKIAIKFSS